MKKIMITLAALGIGAGASLGLGATAALAQAAATPPASFSQADADNSGGVTLAEAQVVLPDLTQDGYEAGDVNKDGTLDQAEFDALVNGTAAPPSATVTPAPTEDNSDDAASPDSPNGTPGNGDGGDDDGDDDGGAAN